MKANTRLYILISVIISMLACVNLHAQKWARWSAFDNNPVRIIDSPARTWYLVHQQYYKKNYSGADFPSLALFERDKSKPERGLYPLIANTGLNSCDIRIADYSPAGAFLFIGYQDGLIDLLDPDGSVATINTLQNSSLPGGSIINSVSFDPVSGDAWVATDCGWLHINGAERKVAKFHRFGQPVSYVAPVGSGLVAIINNSLYRSVTLSPSVSDDFTKIEGITDPAALLVLSGKDFAVVSGKSGANMNVTGFSQDGEEWRQIVLGTDRFTSKSADLASLNPFEGNFIPNRDGFLLYSPTKVYQLTIADNIPTLYSLNSEGLSSTVGSWDMKEFHTYSTRGKFLIRIADYDNLETSTIAQWSDVGEAIRPNAPAAFICAYMDYSPKHGMLVMNHGQTSYLNNDTPTAPLLLSGKKGHEWTVYAPIYHTPRSVEENPSLLPTYNTYINRYPVPDPNGIAVDPLNPDWISCGSMWGGLVFLDLSEPKKDVAHFAAPNDLFRAFPGYVSTTPLQTWGTISQFSNPSYDTNGTLWVTEGNPFQSGGSTIKTRLKFMYAADRKKYYDAEPADYPSIGGWHTIDIPGISAPTWNNAILCGNHPRNRNRIFMCTGILGTVRFQMVIVDHNGDPEDRDNVTFRIINSLSTTTEKKFNIRDFSSIAEDPVTGDLIITGYDGLYRINPDFPVENGAIEGERMHLTGGSPGDIVPTECYVYKAIFDDEGRMWLGTRNMGVIGVNRDRTEVIAHYTMDNSPLPSDWVVGLGWNPESRSLMISTDKGMAEVVPDMSEKINPSADPYLSRSSVSPGYNGTVEIRNITPGTIIIISTPDGRNIRRIPTSGSTFAEWDLKDEEGNPVPSGHYTVTVGIHPPLPLAILR